MEELQQELQEMFEQWLPSAEPSQGLSVSARSARRAGATSGKQCKMCVHLGQAVHIVYFLIQAKARKFKREIGAPFTSSRRRLGTQV